MMLHSSTDGTDLLFMVDSNGRTGAVGPDGVSRLDPSTFTETGSTGQFTSTTLAGVAYVNRSDGPPRYYSVTKQQFLPLPNMDSAWTCNILRSYYDFAIALSVTKAGETYETMVKWSDATLAGQVPSNWDYTDTTNESSLAGENVIAEMTGPIVDAASLKNDFMIYGRNEVWAMTYTGDTTVFTFRKAFGAGGSMAANCALEGDDGYHYVFGSTDLYRHDGASIQSLAQGSVRSFVFNDLDTTKKEACFVVQDSVNKEILFCYPSKSSTATSGSAGCNRAAVYSLASSVWSFIDLPNILCATQCDGSFAALWPDGPGTVWSDDASGEWSDDAGTYVPILAMGGSVATGGMQSLRVLVLDAMTNGTTSFPVAEDGNYPAFLERVGMTFDGSQSAGAPLVASKMMSRVMPLVSVSTGDLMGISLGANMTATSPVVYAAPVTFSPASQYFLNSRVNGRFLAVRVDADLTTDFDLTGFDLDLTLMGTR